MSGTKQDSNFMKTKVYQLALYIFLAALTGILFFVYITYSNLKFSTKETKEVTETLRSLRTLENIFDASQDIETGFRGFLLSKDPVFLAPFDRATLQVKTDTSVLKHIPSSVSGRREDVSELIFDLRSEINIANHLINDKSLNSDDSSSHLPLIRHAKAMMDRIRFLIEKMENEDRLILNKANAARQESAQKTTILFTGFALIFILFFVAAFFYVRRNLVHNFDVERELTYLGSLVNQTSDAMYSTDTNYIIRSWNKGAEAMYGFSAEEAIGNSSHNLLQMRLTKEEIEAVTIELNKKGNYQGEYGVHHKNKTPLMILSSLAVLRDEKGAPTGYVIAHRNITERKNWEEKIKSFNAELETQVREKTNEIKDVFERVSDAFVSIDSTGKLNYLNKKAAQLLKLNSPQILGTSLEKALSHSDYFPLVTQAHQAIQSQETSKAEQFIESTQSWFEIFFYPSQEGLSIYLRDITEQKKTLEDILISNERFRLIARATNDAIWEWNYKSNITWANAMHQQLYGLTMADPVPDNKEWEKRIHPDERNEVVNEFNEVLYSHRNSWTKEYRFLTEANGYQHIYDRTFIIRDEDGAPIRMLGSMLNINDLKKAEALLEQERNLLRTLIDNIPDYIFVKDEDLRYRINNKARINLLGFTSEAQTIGKTIQELLKDPFAETLLSVDKKVLETGRAIFNMEEEMPQPNGEIRYLLTSKIPLIDPNGKSAPLLLGISRDITEQKRLTKQVEENNKQLKQLADRLQNIREEERLNISKEIHEELGQRMSVMKMDIAWIAKKMPREDPAMEKLENTLKILDGTIHIIRQLAAKLRPGILDDLGLVPALEWQSRDFEEKSGIPVHFFTNISDKEIPSAISIGIFRIFQESMLNCIRHSKATAIDCSLLKDEDNLLVLTIQDNGLGFELGALDMNNSLGIMGMRERAERINGLYKINSYPGKGTTVTVQIRL